MDNVREHLDADCVHAVVQVHSHHRGDRADAAAGLLLRLRGEGDAGGVGLRDAEPGHEADHSAGDAPFDDHGTLLPELGDQFHDVDLLLVVVLVWLVVYVVFLHVFYFMMLPIVAIIVPSDAAVVEMLRNSCS